MTVLIVLMFLVSNLKASDNIENYLFSNIKGKWVKEKKSVSSYGLSTVRYVKKEIYFFDFIKKNSKIYALITIKVKEVKVDGNLKHLEYTSLKKGVMNVEAINGACFILRGKIIIFKTINGKKKITTKKIINSKIVMEFNRFEILHFSNSGNISTALNEKFKLERASEKKYNLLMNKE